MSDGSERVKKWRAKTKSRLLEALGRKCIICGYSKCESALDFHHVVPSTKSFGLGAARGTIKNWKLLVEEAKKCVILCCRCHREHHEGLIEIPTERPIFDSVFEDYKKLDRMQKLDGCPICGKEKQKKSVTCSQTCAKIKNRKVDWEKVDLEKLYKTKSLVAIGKMLGVSDNAVRKHLKKKKIIGE